MELVTVIRIWLTSRDLQKYAVTECRPSILLTRSCGLNRRQCKVVLKHPILCSYHFEVCLLRRRWVSPSFAPKFKQCIWRAYLNGQIANWITLTAQKFVVTGRYTFFLGDGYKKLTIHFWRWQIRASSYNWNKLTNQMQQFHKFFF